MASIATLRRLYTCCVYKSGYRLGAYATHVAKDQEREVQGG